MPKKIANLAAVCTICALIGAATGTWVLRRAKRRAAEVAVAEGSIRIQASGVLKTTVSVYDGNDIANAGFDFDLVENHRDALRQLGFASVHVETAAGQTLDRPL